MDKFIIGVPVIDFINWRTKEEVKLAYSTQYDNYGEEIEIGYAFVPEGVEQVQKWLTTQLDNVVIRLTFETRSNDVDSDRTSYIEEYRLISIDKPYAKNGSMEESTVFQIKMRVVRL